MVLYSKVSLCYDFFVRLSIDIVSHVVQLGSMPIVVVNDNDAARELFISQHSAVMSRPVTYTFQ